MDNIIIEKVINNNIISAYEKSGAEVIVMGRGIGFKKKQGEMVPADQISKIFRIKSRTLAEQFKALLANMPLERVRISDEIISHAKDHLKLKLNQSIYVTLTDHINFAIERVSQGIEPQNALLWEIKRFYPQEFQLGIYALELIQDRFAILKFDLKTPGREDDDMDETTVKLANDNFTEVAKIILEGVGGKENVASIDNCITRLRLEIKDYTAVDEKKIKSAGVAGVIRPGKNSVQVVIGTKVQFVADEFKKLCK